MEGMKKHNIAKISVYLIFIFSIVLFGTIVYAQDLPIFTFFYGNATVNGRNVPVDSVLTAKVDGEKRGEITIDNAGEYGRIIGDYKLGVSGNSGDIGRDIEFYVKLQGIEEIKADQTFQWKNSSINNLDLTFTGEEIPESKESGGSPSISGGSSGGSGGGGSGGGGGGGTTNPTIASFYYNIIEAGRQVIISLKDSDIPLTKLQLILNNNAEDVDFNFEVVDNEPSNAPRLDYVYKYISIDAPKINEDNVKIAIIRFKVKNSWFKEDHYDSEKVRLLRYNNQWEELETVHEGSDANHNYYRAATPGFSYFAIKSEKSEIIREEIEISENEPKEEGLIEITGKVVAITGANPIVGVTIVFIIIIVGVSFYYFITRNKKVGKR